MPMVSFASILSVLINSYIKLLTLYIAVMEDQKNIVNKQVNLGSLTILDYVRNPKMKLIMTIGLC